MKIQSLFRKRLFISLMAITAVIALGLTAFIAQNANARSTFSDFTANKIARLNQETAKHVDQARQYQATHPNNNPEILPMGSDPKQKAERIPPDIGWGIGWLYNGPYNVSELWIVGDKPNNEQRSWNPSYAYSGSFKDNPKQGFIGTFVMNGASDHSWSGNWKTPQLWGSVRITNVTGSVISFNSDSGVTGTFDLETHEWKTN
ncbi:hypothetical protein Desaci_4055 [Desulfosporosinus acidiphilus SJ4]|uniref:Uncharacterized protein n=1 Tax=Desulfosporosinus acidiphilus (strain DSM 22704 / JCM 16185 / SJ4) TaxID=646529 RepID=I4DAU6_DESAJ|nr:hypothetical protein [Desulfosporosinus acidiphilus]AFM42920.1 hypothetical protein Desaci_4055 [Desulfosporosinus acidiphilus SJ4]